MGFRRDLSQNKQLNAVPSSIIVSSFGFTTLQTTLLGCVDGVIESKHKPYHVPDAWLTIIPPVATIWTGVTLANKWENSRAYVATIYFFPNVLGSILVNSMHPWLLGNM